jgi:hydroxymethylpyrimidine pyrophosphatase-like HAD family hydrolase
VAARSISAGDGQVACQARLRSQEVVTGSIEIPLAEVVAIGDGANDIPLLSTAGLAIAVDNASAELKAVADYITLDVDHQGVAAAIDKYLL